MKSLIIVLIAQALLFHGCLAHSTPGPVTIDTCWAIVDNHTTVKFSLENRSELNISIETSKLPWNGDGAIIIAYVGDRLTGRTLNRVYPVEDARPGRISLSSSNHVKGEVVLDRYFRGADKAEYLHDLKVLWSYVLKAGSSLYRFGGTVDFGSAEDMCGQQPAPS